MFEYVHITENFREHWFDADEPIARGVVFSVPGHGTIKDDPSFSYMLIF